jgi:hypothetical protein
MNRQNLSRLTFHLLASAVVAAALTSSASAEWKEKVLYSFQGGTDGSTHAGGVVFDAVGNLYGATTDGGSSCPSPGCGTVFQLAPPATKGGAWTETILFGFSGNDGSFPAGSVIVDANGNLYGTTAYGGSGTCILLGGNVGCGIVYELSPPLQKGGQWTYRVLYNFQGGKDDGQYPWGNLTLDKAGNLFGATQFGGGKGYNNCNKYYGYCGIVYKLSPPKVKGGKWTEKVLHSFAGGTDGANPNGGLIFDTKGTIYGTTYGGGNESGECGAAGCGTAFELYPPGQESGAWAETVLHRFNRNTSDSGLPSAGFVMDAKDNLYGTTVGTAFRLAPPSTRSGHWKETILYTFNQEAYGPEGALIFDQAGNLDGTTNVGNGQSLHGSVFQLRPPRQGGSWIFGLIHGFLGPPDGDFPAASLIFDKNGDLYSTTQAGGTGTGCGRGGCGTVFEAYP